MKTNGNDKTLESYKIFPFVAWGLVIGFVYLVYGITMDLKTTTQELKVHTERLQANVDSPNGEVKDYKR